MIEQFSIKHRARTFEDLFGQPQIKEQLIKRAKAKNWPKAMLLQGPYGTGKTTAAYLIAQSLQCTNPDRLGNPCNECSACLSIASERFNRDTVMLDGAQLSGKDAVVDFTSTINIKPMYDKNRIYIIEEADQLSSAAVNALLKVLEQPQENVYFILLSMQNGGIPPAIKSRCQTFLFKPVGVSDTMYLLKSILEKEGKWDALPDSFKLEGLALIAASAKGSLRESVQYMEQCLVGEYYEPSEIEQLFSTIDEVKTFKILEGLLQKSKDPSLWKSIYNADPMELYNYITSVLADVIIFQQTGFINDDRFSSSVRGMGRNPNVAQLFDLFGNPTFSKGYIRKADVLMALGKYYASSIQEIPTRRIVR